tara:strand:- start:1096 stop:1488 length:393 start_codon:yes stop_codon:yes gene_type:complete
MEELLAQERLEMARQGKKQDQENPGSGDPDSKVEQETASYIDAISSAVAQRWRIPGNYRNRNDIRTRVRIRMVPGGDVVNVDVVKSSGYPDFDDSVVKGVQLASPLPVPKGDGFEAFRTLVLEFEPGDAK